MIYEFCCILHCTRLCGKFFCCAGRLEKLSGYSFMVLSELRFLHGRVLLWVGKLSNTQSEISPAGPVLQGSKDLLGSIIGTNRNRAFAAGDNPFWAAHSSFCRQQEIRLDSAFPRPRIFKFADIISLDVEL